MSRRRFDLMRLASLSISVLAPGAHAGTISFYDLFKTIAYDQTSNAQPTTPAGYFGTVGVTSTSPTDFTAAEVTSVSPLSPMMLSGSAGNFIFSTPFVASKTSLDNDLPNGTVYSYDISGGTLGTQSATLSTPASDAYSATVPFLTNNGFTALQGVNAGDAITLDWNSYATPTGVNTPLIFVGISQVSDGSLAFGTSGNNLLTSATVAPNTLQPGTQYDLDLVYSARIVTENAGFGTGTSFASYDVRTDLLFTTGTVPEPSTFALAALGGLALAAARRLRRRAVR